MNKKGILIFSGYNDREIIAFCRFCANHHIPFFIIAANKKDKILLSRYRANVIHIRNTSELSVDILKKYRSILSEKFSCEEAIILPSTEFLNRFLLQKRETLESMGYLIPLCPREVYETISDKYLFCHLCQQYGIITPREINPREPLHPPLVVKPKTYFVGEGTEVNIKPRIIHHIEDINELRSLILSKDVFIQEFVEGRSIYLLFYFDKNRSFWVYSQENFIQQYGGRSIIAARSSNFHNQAFTQSFIKLFQAIDFQGLVMVEVRYTGENFCMIEANPRLWGPSQLVNDAGMKLFAQWAKDLGLLENIPHYEYQEGVEYFWSGGILEDARLGNSVIFHNYSKERFFDEYEKWLQKEVYLNTDTIDIFFQELHA